MVFRVLTATAALFLFGVVIHQVFLQEGVTAPEVPGREAVFDPKGSTFSIQGVRPSITRNSDPNFHCLTGHLRSNDYVLSGSIKADPAEKERFIFTIGRLLQGDLDKDSIKVMQGSRARCCPPPILYSPCSHVVLFLRESKDGSGVSVSHKLQFKTLEKMEKFSERVVLYRDGMKNGTLGLRLLKELESGNLPELPHTRPDLLIKDLQRLKNSGMLPGILRLIDQRSERGSSFNCLINLLRMAAELDFDASAARIRKIAWSDRPPKGMSQDGFSHVRLFALGLLLENETDPAKTERLTGLIEELKKK